MSVAREDAELKRKREAERYWKRMERAERIDSWLETLFLWFPVGLVILAGIGLAMTGSKL